MGRSSLSALTLTLENLPNYLCISRKYLFVSPACSYKPIPKEDPKNVVVVHCEAGKGRTGTVIASMLVYGGYFDKAEDALDFYGRKRFSDRTGVTQPSQRRYVGYLEDVYKGRVVSPQPKEFKKFVICTKPDISKFRPYFEIYHSNGKTLVTFPFLCVRRGT